MRTLPLVLAALLAFAACISGSQPEADPRVDPADLVGTWTVDLRPTPDSDPYFQPFVVERVGDGTFAGRFYGAPFEGGLLNTSWGALHFAFTTADGRTEYHTSGVLEGGRLRGTTHAVSRGFLSVWTAERGP